MNANHFADTQARVKEHKALNVPRAEVPDDQNAHIAKTLERIKNEAGTRVDELAERVADVSQRLAKAEKNGHIAIEHAGFDALPIYESESFARFKSGLAVNTGHLPLDLSVKALTNPGAGESPGYTAPTPAQRIPGLFGFPLRRLSILDVFRARPVTSYTVEYAQLNWTGGAATQDEEGAEKAEVNFDGHLETANIATIAVHATASAQILDDYEGLSAELQRIMGHQVRSEIERNLMVGSGLPQKINGLYTQAVPITTAQPEIPDRLGEAITEMDVEGYASDLILMHPRDWRRISFMKNAQGDYLYGNPAAPIQPFLWNLPVVTTPSLPEGTALVGDSAQVEILDRMQPTVFLSRDHKDYRTRNLVLILVEARAGLALYDRMAFRRVSLTPTS